jgi:hypothetical protein
MRFVRRWRAWVVLGGSFAAAAWVYSYRLTTVVVVTYYDRHGAHHFRRAGDVTGQPWWSTPAAVLLLVIGISLFVRLLPARVRLLRICASRLTPRF